MYNLHEGWLIRAQLLTSDRRCDLKNGSLSTGERRVPLVPALKIISILFLLIVPSNTRLYIKIDTLVSTSEFFSIFCKSIDGRNIGHSREQSYQNYRWPKYKNSIREVRLQMTRGNSFPCHKNHPSRQMYNIVDILCKTILKNDYKLNIDRFDHSDNSSANFAASKIHTDSNYNILNLQSY